MFFSKFSISIFALAIDLSINILLRLPHSKNAEESITTMSLGISSLLITTVSAFPLYLSIVDVFPSVLMLQFSSYRATLYISFAALFSTTLLFVKLLYKVTPTIKDIINIIATIIFFCFLFLFIVASPISNILSLILLYFKIIIKAME